MPCSHQQRCHLGFSKFKIHTIVSPFFLKNTLWRGELDRSQIISFNYGCLLEFVQELERLMKALLESMRMGIAKFGIRTKKWSFSFSKKFWRWFCELRQGCMRWFKFLTVKLDRGVKGIQIHKNLWHLCFSLGPRPHLIRNPWG